jgi:hypothetical protein
MLMPKYDIYSCFRCRFRLRLFATRPAASLCEMAPSRRYAAIFAIDELHFS